MRKVWYHQIWIQNTLGFMVSDLMYLDTIWNESTCLIFYSFIFPDNWTSECIHSTKIAGGIPRSLHLHGANGRQFVPGMQLCYIKPKSKQTRLIYPLVQYFFSLLDIICTVKLGDKKFLTTNLFLSKRSLSPSLTVVVEIFSYTYLTMFDHV